MVLLLSATCASNAQSDSVQQLLFNQIYSAAEKAYGMPRELMNGALIENENQDVKGHPYFLDYYTNQGSAIYRGKRYSNLDLRYDLYDQQVLLIYVDNQVEYKLWLQKEFITEFTVENRTFIFDTPGDEKEAKIYQVIGEDGPVRVLYFREKGLINMYAGNADKKAYSEQKETYILMDNRLVSYTGNRSFVRKFSAKGNTAIKKYLRKNNTRVKQASDAEMGQLVEYINTLTL